MRLILSSKKGKISTFPANYRSNGLYKHATLESCTCPDFKERKLPCKHMYRLASELGLIELPDPDFKN